MTPARSSPTRGSSTPRSPARTAPRRPVRSSVNQEFDLYLDGEQIFDRATFRNSLDGVSQVDYYANSSNYGSVHVDDIRVSQGIGIAPDDAGLATLDTDQGEPVATGDGGYRLEVPASVSEVEVTAMAQSPFARSVAIDGQESSGPEATQRIALGATGAEVGIVVTAEDGSQAEYLLAISREQASDSDATLTDLAPSAGQLNPAFAPDQSWYRLLVPAGVKKITLTPTATNPEATIRVNGRPVQSGDTSKSIVVPVWWRWITVDVVSADGAERARYVILVSRGLPPRGAVEWS